MSLKIRECAIRERAQKGLARQDPFDEGSLSDDAYVSL